MPGIKPTLTNLFNQFNDILLNKSQTGISDRRKDENPARETCTK